MSTILPVTVTPECLLEFRETINAICQQDIGRQPPWDDPKDLCANIMLLMALNGSTGPQLAEWLYAQPEAIAYRAAQRPV